MLENYNLWFSLDFDMEKKIAEPVGICHALGQKEKNPYKEIKTRFFEKLLCFLQLDYINYFYVRNQ